MVVLHIRPDSSKTLRLYLPFTRLYRILSGLNILHRSVYDSRIPLRIRHAVHIGNRKGVIREGLYRAHRQLRPRVLHGPGRQRARGVGRHRRFLLGFYDRFIGSLDDLFHGARAARFAAVRFLLKLGAGWAIGFGLSALVLTSFFDTHIYEVSSLFMGFIVFAIPIVVREELDALRKRLPYLAFAVVASHSSWQ